MQRMGPDELIEEATRRLAAAAPGAKVVLFGSRARGEARPDSDLDLLVIEEKDVDDPRAESARLRRELRGLGIGLDLVVVGTGYVEEWGQVEGSVVEEALTRGRVLIDPSGA